VVARRTFGSQVFTLIILLVVFTSTSLLVGLPCPGGQSAREAVSLLQSKSTLCNYGLVIPKRPTKKRAGNLEGLRCIGFLSGSNYESACRALPDGYRSHYVDQIGTSGFPCFVALLLLVEQTVV
jgi:hypothetical protein